MLAKRIIPCLDVKDGRVVKGVNFVGLRDAGDPVECASKYSKEGADEITFLDITASHEKRATIIDVVQKTAHTIGVPLTVGGGIRSKADAKQLLLAGADKVSINSAAVKRPELVRELSEAYGSQAIVVAIDAKRVDDSQSGSTSWKVFTHGGRNQIDLDVIEWAQQVTELGAGEILLTSMDRDGTQCGYDLELTRTVAENVTVPVIASGGVGDIGHIVDGFTKGKADAALAASIFHDGKYSVHEVKVALQQEGVCMRVERTNHPNC